MIEWFYLRWCKLTGKHYFSSEIRSWLGKIGVDEIDDDTRRELLRSGTFRSVYKNAIQKN